MYNLTKKLHTEIDRIRAGNEGISEIEGDEYFFEVWESDGTRTYKISRKDENENNDVRDLLFPALTQKSIKTLLRDLNNAGLLGENAEYIELKERSDYLIEEMANWDEGYEMRMKANMTPKTKAEALEFKWFLSKNIDNKLLPSLFEEKPKEVLGELLEILKGIK